MRPRSQLPAQERQIRSRLTRILHNEMILNGSLVTMARTCGNPRCKCAQGDKHVSLYLSTRTPEGRKMIYIPADLEETIRRWVRNAQDARRLIDEISRACLGRLGSLKQARRASGSAAAGETQGTRRS